MNKCEICGKSFVELEIGLKKYNNQKIILVPDCDCLEKQREKQEEELQRSQKAVILSKKFENSLLTPFFQEKEFKKLPETDIKNKLKKYIDEFNPRESGGILFIGDIGTGKTTLLACTCKELIIKGYNCLFIKMSALLDKFMGSYNFNNNESVRRILSWLRQYDFIVIDDLGREKYTEKRLEVAFDMFDELMNYKKCIGITANQDMIAKLKVIPDFAAIFDRIHEMCGIKETFKGKSFRR